MMTTRTRPTAALPHPFALMLAAVLALAGFAASSASAAVVTRVTLTESQPGLWDVHAEVIDGKDQTAGIASFNIDLDGIPADQVAYTSPTLLTLNAANLPVGFGAIQSGTITDTFFNAGGAQLPPGTSVPSPIFNLGEKPVTIGSLNLGVPLWLGSFHTPEEVSPDHFDIRIASLFNEAQDGIVSQDVETRLVVVPEPTTAALLAALTPLFLRRPRHSSRHHPLP